MSPKLRLHKRNFYCFIAGLIIGLITVWLIVFHDDSRMSVTSVPKSRAVEHVVFIKTHKTGSSSVQNMLLRYGASRNLMFGFPRLVILFGYPERFDAKMAMKLKPGLKYNIFAQHTRFSRQGFSSIMPNNTQYFTILRDPVDAFEAAYSYFYLEWFMNMTLEEFVSADESEAMRKTRDQRSCGYLYGRNQMSFDLGLDVSSFEKPDYIAQFAEQMEKDIDLVMITERMPESLILLKHILHWSTEDIIIFNHNFRKDKFKKAMTPELKAGILRWNRADKYIYDHFKPILEKKIVTFGFERMQAELKDLHETTLRWYNFCMESKAEIRDLNDTNKVENYVGHTNFKPKHGYNRTCEYLTKREPMFNFEIYEHMWKYYDTNFHTNFTRLVYTVLNIILSSISERVQTELTI